MKLAARFVITLVVCLLISTLAWNGLVEGNVYYCTDGFGYDFLSPGDWLHGEVRVVSRVDKNVTMAEPDQLLQGWSMEKLSMLWGAMLAACLMISVGGCLCKKTS